MLANCPTPLTWHKQPETYRLESDKLTLFAPAQTDLFSDPVTATQVQNAPMLLFPVPGDCTLSATITVDFKAMFDAGVLMVYQDAQHWAKLCFERDPSGNPSIVSVVTKGHSDDCNSYRLATDMTRLRIARLGDAFAFHHAHDAKTWQLIRLFSLTTKDTQLGFLAQSPTGRGCAVTFRDIVYQTKRLDDVRSGE